MGISFFFFCLLVIINVNWLLNEYTNSRSIMQCDAFRIVLFFFHFIFFLPVNLSEQLNIV